MLKVFASLVSLVQQPDPNNNPQGGVNATPSSSGMPGGDLIQQLLNWAMMAALWGSLGAILVGAAMYGLAREGGYSGQAHRGKTLALGGAVGAILAGLGPTAVNLLFEAANS